MKILLNIILFISLGIFLSSCEKDTGVDVPDGKLKVIESNILFEQEGGTGFIKIESEENISATTEQEWITISVSGKTVNVSVGVNKNIGGRNGIITIKAGNEKVDMSVIQLSSVFYLENVDDYSLKFPFVGLTKEIPYKSSLPIVLTAQDTWVKAIVSNNGTIDITVDPSAGIVRSSKVTFAVTFADGSESKKEIIIKQEASYLDILGEWNFEYTNPSLTGRQTDIVTITEKTTDASVLLEDLPANSTKTVKGNVLLTYNTSNSNLLVNMGQLVATINPHYIYLCARTSGGSLSYTNTIQMLGEFSNNNGTLTYTFKDNGTWSGQVVGGWGLYGYTTSPPSGSQVTYIRYMDIVMTKRQ